MLSGSSFNTTTFETKPNKIYLPTHAHCDLDVSALILGNFLCGIDTLLV